jgi:hypothetical protein
LASKQRGSEKGGNGNGNVNENGNGNRKLAEVAPPGLRLAENGMIVLADLRYDQSWDENLFPGFAQIS